jgi:cobyrinic acid a,c-diamide synthase
LLREALESAGVPVFGVLRRVAQVDTPSRHLGLVPVAERRGDAVDSVAAMAEQVAQGCDLEALVGLARGAGALPYAPWDAAEVLGAAPPDPHRPEGPRPQTPDGLEVTTRWASQGRGELRDQPPPGPQPSSPVVAVAGGPAFTFSYAEHSELLTAAGAEVVVFDPLHDEQLPDGTAGLVIGGGFPEVYAAELSANEPLRKAVAALAETGAPVAAECAGLLYLCRELDGQPMCGVLDASARMEETLTLGYRDAVAVSDSSLAVAGTRMRGHEFHRTVVEPGAGDAAAWGVRVPRRRLEGFVQRGVHASYLHTHWASQPGVARRFVERCRTS